MKRVMNIIVIVLLVGVAVALAIPAYKFIGNNPISYSNSLKATARKNYITKEYAKAYEDYKVLVDSLKVTEEPVILNYAHSAFLTADVMRRFYNQNTGPEQNVVGDSSLQQLSSLSQDQYVKLTGSSAPYASSVAFNQLGYSLLRGTKVFESANSDSLLLEALHHFKNALRKDPQNDSIRYNYELIKQIIHYPETVLAETKALVAQQKYRAAADLLQRGMKRDPRLRRQQDFYQRLRIVIQIDSLNTRRL